MAYIKPQYPLKSGENYIYPPTTADQVIVGDGKRLSGVGVYLDKPNEGENTTIAGINADTLGGIAASDFVLKTDTIKNAVNADHAIKADYSVEADHSVKTDHAVEADHSAISDIATEATHATSSDNTSSLGGIVAANYALKSDLGVSMALLWENESVATAFEAQTVSVDGADCDLYMVLFVLHQNYTNEILSRIIPVGYGGSISDNAGSSGTFSGTPYHYKRLINSSSESEIAFSNCNCAAGTSSFTANNSGLIPFRIYGIKGVK